MNEIQSGYQYGREEEEADGEFGREGHGWCGTAAVIWYHFE